MSLIQIRADDASLFVGKDAVRWLSPYLTIRQLRAAVGLWAKRLQRLTPGATVLLPYSISDELVEAFEATLTDTGVVSLRIVLADAIGFDPDEDDPVAVMGSELPIVERRVTPFGEYELEELPRALHRMG